MSWTVTPIVARRAWLNSTKMFRGISPATVTRVVPGTVRSRSRIASACRTRAALSAPPSGAVTANTAP